MNDTIRQFRDFFVSLRLTVVLLVLGMVLIFAATLDQVNLGIWGVQQKYFHSLFVLWRVRDVPVPVFPGGYFIGGLLLINLISAHIYRFKFGAKKLGIWLAHVGLILLLLGELFSGLWQEVYTMKIDQGQTTRYAEHERRFELALIDLSDPKADQVVAIPDHLLSAGTMVQHPKLPFRVAPKAYWPNSIAQPRAQVPNAPPSPANTGDFNERYAIIPQPISHQDDKRNIPGAAVELLAPTGSLGTWLLTSAVPILGPSGNIADIEEWRVPSPQGFEYNGKPWAIALRPERNYKPFALTLLELKHENNATTSRSR
jgi:hypothetical protein